MVLRYTGFPPFWTPVHIPLLDPFVHAAALGALLLWFIRTHHLDSWHLGLDRGRLDAASGWALAILALASLGAVAALTNSVWIDRAPEIFYPANLLRRAAQYAPGRTTTWLALAFVLLRAGVVASLEAVVLTGLLYPTLRRRFNVLWSVLAGALAAGLLHARPTECGVDPCLWPAAQAFAAQSAAGAAGAVAYERWRTLWLALLLRSGFELARMAPGLTAVFFG